MHDQTTRRLADGSIDYNHYMRRGRRLRAEAQREFFNGRRGMARLAVALAVMFAAPVLAAGLQKFNSGPSAAVQPPVWLAQNLR